VPSDELNDDGQMAHYSADLPQRTLTTLTHTSVSDVGVDGRLIFKRILREPEKPTTTDGFDSN
jgi:hypothetical protein